MALAKSRIAKLRRLLKRTSPGPWVEDDCSIFSVPLGDERDAAIERMMTDRSLPHPDGDCGDPLGFVATAYQHRENSDLDAALIVGMRNAFEELLDAAERAESNAAELAAHREALAEIHKRVARGDGHGTVAMTRDCTISAILDLKAGLIEERESVLRECEEIAEARIDVSDGTGSEYDRGWARCAQVIRDHIRALPGFPKDSMV